MRCVGSARDCRLRAGVGGEWQCGSGTIEIEMGGARVRVSGVVDAAALRLVLSHLRRKP